MEHCVRGSCFRRAWLWSTGTRSFICLSYHPFPPRGHLPGHKRIKGHKRVDSSSVITHLHTGVMHYRDFAVYTPKIWKQALFLCYNPDTTSCNRGRRSQKTTRCYSLSDITSHSVKTVNHLQWHVEWLHVDWVMVDERFNGAVNLLGLNSFQMPTILNQLL